LNVEIGLPVSDRSCQRMMQAFISAAISRSAPSCGKFNSRAHIVRAGGSVERTAGKRRFMSRPRAWSAQHRALRLANAGSGAFQIVAMLVRIQGGSSLTAVRGRGRRFGDRRDQPGEKMKSPAFTPSHRQPEVLGISTWVCRPTAWRLLMALSLSPATTSS